MPRRGNILEEIRAFFAVASFLRFQYVYFNIHTNKVFIIFFFLYEIERHCISVYSVSMCLLPKDTNILLYKIVAKNKE